MKMTPALNIAAAKINSAPFIVSFLSFFNVEASIKGMEGA